VPRNRTVRVAVLGSSVQRAATPGLSSTRSSALRRKLVVGGLVLLSLVLITVSFRSTALDGVEGAGASALRPFEIAANRVARPFRDATDYTRGLLHAKSENEKLRHELEVLRRQVAAGAAAQQQNVELQKLLRYASAPSFPEDYDTVAAQVLTNPPTFDQTVTISAGSNQGVREQDVVVTNGSLVGQVTKVFANVARVMLITDPSSAVRAVDESSPGAVGMLEHGSGTDSLMLDQVDKAKKVEVGDTVITAGSPGTGRLPSLFPRDIPIGVVTSTGQNDTDIFKQIQVQPFVDLGSVQSVLVLLPKKGKR
jgi:rod shape-determining protein MreC